MDVRREDFECDRVVIIALGILSRIILAFPAQRLEESEEWPG